MIATAASGTVTTVDKSAPDLREAIAAKKGAPLYSGDPPTISTLPELPL